MPVAIRFRLVSGGNLKGKHPAVFEGRPAMEPKTQNAQHGEVDCQHIPFRSKLPRSLCLLQSTFPVKKHTFFCVVFLFFFLLF
jgi:hypothetical protein